MFSCTRRITTPDGIDDEMNYKRIGTSKPNKQRTNKERKKNPQSENKKKEIATEGRKTERGKILFRYDASSK